MSNTLTFSDWVEKVYRRVSGTSIDVNVQLATSLDASTTVFNITVPTITNTITGATAIRVGSLLAVDYEIMLVTQWDNVSSVTVSRGYNGSTATTHAANSIIYIQPRYSRYDISVALNDELRRLSSPDMGLFQVNAQTITFNPVYMGYDLQQAVNDNYIDILEVRHKIPFPSRNYPKIGKWKVLRSIPDATIFPSGQGIVFYEGGYPGQPVFVQYSCAFKMVDITDSLQMNGDLGGTYTDANGNVVPTTGMTNTMLDIPPLGVEIQLTLPREIRRNFTDVQPDPRKAPEIPSMSVSNSVQAMQIVYNQRVSEEAGRLARQYTRTESW